MPLHYSAKMLKITVHISLNVPDCKNYECDIFKWSLTAKIGNYLYFVAKTFTSPNSGRECCGELSYGSCLTNG